MPSIFLHSSASFWKIPTPFSKGKLNFIHWCFPSHLQESLGFSHLFNFFYIYVCVCVCVCVCNELVSHAQVCNPMDYHLPDCSVHGILQARILEWIAFSFSRESFQPRDQIHIFCNFCIGRQILYHWATWNLHYMNYQHALLWLANYRSPHCLLSNLRAEIISSNHLPFPAQWMAQCQCSMNILVVINKG